MDSKIFWADTETLGLDPKRSSMVQLAGLIEINGEVVDHVNLTMSPMVGSFIDKEALKVNGRKIRDIMKYKPSIFLVDELKKKLGEHVDKYDIDDKFVIAGYNVNFDIGFIRQTFMETGDKYYGSWFVNAPLDVWTTVALAYLKKNLRLPNYKLVTVCHHYGITIKKAHDAMDDVIATRRLHYAIVKDLKQVKQENGTENSGENSCQQGNKVPAIDSGVLGAQAEAQSQRVRRPRYIRHS